MKQHIFIPKKLKVGLQKRGGTYTGHLAYVTYYDEKDVLRKEKSWESWRDSKITPLDLENVPTSGFVLNKKAGGYSSGWNHRQTYVRIYDPRNFEFEITVQNLLYILENTNSIKGKGLEGEFVYGWDGTELILIPTSAPDYQEMQEYSDILHTKTYVKAKELKLGATYKTKQNETIVYLGRFECFGYHGSSEGKQHVFAESLYSDCKRFLRLKSLGNRIISAVSETPIENYAEIMDSFESTEIFSPYDPSKDEYVSYPCSEFIQDARRHARDGYFSRFYFYNEQKKPLNIRKKDHSKNLYEVYQDKTYSYSAQPIFSGTLKEIFEKTNPMYLNKYLKNGKLLNKKAR